MCVEPGEEGGFSGRLLGETVDAGLPLSSDFEIGETSFREAFTCFEAL